jgi:hypothetical protein
VLLLLLLMVRGGVVVLWCRNRCCCCYRESQYVSRTGRNKTKQFNASPGRAVRRCRCRQEVMGIIASGKSVVSSSSRQAVSSRQS